MAVTVATLLLAALAGSLIGRAAGQEIRDRKPIPADYSRSKPVTAKEPWEAHKIVADASQNWRGKYPSHWQRQMRYVRGLLERLLEERIGRRAPCAEPSPPH